MSGDWYFMRRRWIGGAKKLAPSLTTICWYGSIKVRFSPTRYCLAAKHVTAGRGCQRSGRRSSIGASCILNRALVRLRFASKLLADAEPREHTVKNVVGIDLTSHFT